MTIENSNLDEQLKRSRSLKLRLELALNDINTTLKKWVGLIDESNSTVADSLDTEKEVKNPE